MAIVRPTSETTSDHSGRVVAAGSSPAATNTPASAEEGADADNYVSSEAGRAKSPSFATHLLYEPLLPEDLSRRRWEGQWKRYLGESQVEQTTADFATDLLAAYFREINGIHLRFWERILFETTKRRKEAIDPNGRMNILDVQARGAVIAFLPQIGVPNESFLSLPSTVSEEEMVVLLSEAVTADYVVLFPQWRPNYSVVPIVEGLLDRVIDLYCREFPRNEQSQTEALRSQIKKSALELIEEFNSEDGAAPIPGEVPEFSASPGARLDERFSAYAEEWKRTEKSAVVDTGLMRRAYLRLTDRIRDRAAIDLKAAAAALRDESQDSSYTQDDERFLSGFIAFQQRDIETWRSLVLDREIGLVRHMSRRFALPPGAHVALAALANESAVDMLASPSPRSPREISRMVVGDALADFPEASGRMAGFYLGAFQDWLSAVQGSLTTEVDLVKTFLYRIATMETHPPQSGDEIYERARQALEPSFFTSPAKLMLVQQMLGLKPVEIDMRVEAQRAFEHADAKRNRREFRKIIAKEKKAILAIDSKAQDLVRRTNAIYNGLNQLEDRAEFPNVKQDEITKILSASVATMTKNSLSTFADELDECSADIARLRSEAKQLEADRASAVASRRAQSFFEGIEFVWHVNTKVSNRLASVNEKLNKAECIVRTARQMAEEQRRNLAANASDEKLPAGANAEIIRAKEMYATIGRALAEVDAAKSDAEFVASNARIVVGSILRTASNVHAFRAALDDAENLNRSSFETFKALKAADAKLAEVMDAKEETFQPAQTSELFNALYEAQKDLTAAIAEPILATMEHLDHISAKARTARTEIERLIVSLDLARSAIDDALKARESTLPIAAGASVPKAVLRMEAASYEAYEFRPSSPGHELDKEYENLFVELLEGQVLSLPLRGESYMLSKSKAAELKKWMIERDCDWIARDVFGNLIPLSAGEYGIHLAKFDQLPAAHSLRSLAAHMKNLTARTCNETTLLIMLMKAGSKGLLSTPAVGRDIGAVTPAALLCDLLAWMARSPLTPSEENSRLIVGRWAITNRQNVLLVNNGEARPYFVERVRHQAVRGRNRGNGGNGMGNTGSPAPAASGPASPIASPPPAADARSPLQPVGRTAVAVGTPFEILPPPIPAESMLDGAAAAYRSIMEAGEALSGGSVETGAQPTAFAAPQLLPQIRGIIAG